MDGSEFCNFLQSIYTRQDQLLYGNFSFEKWLPKDNTYSFQFMGKTQRKSIPQNWLIDAKNAQGRGEVINRNWFNNNYNEKNFNDCRASIAMWLLKSHDFADI